MFEQVEISPAWNFFKCRYMHFLNKIVLLSSNGILINFTAMWKRDNILIVIIILERTEEISDWFSSPVGWVWLRPDWRSILRMRFVNRFWNNSLNINGFLDVFHVLYWRRKVDVMYFRCAIVTSLVTENKIRKIF